MSARKKKLWASAVKHLFFCRPPTSPHKHTVGKFVAHRSRHAVRTYKPCNPPFLHTRSPASDLAFAHATMTVWTARKRRLQEACELVDTAWKMELVRAGAGLLLHRNPIWPMPAKWAWAYPPGALWLSLELEQLEAARYSVPRTRWPKTSAYMMEIFNRMSEADFRQHVRMDRPAFARLCDLLRPHSIFSNNSYAEQAPVEQQAAVALERLGKYGTGAAPGVLKRIYGIGKGTVDLYTARVITALVDMAGQVIRWPNVSERQRIKEAFAEDGFFDCIGLIDGTLIPLSARPGKCGEVYFDRKHNHSIAAQVVCDHRRRITTLHVGFPGSCADVTVFRAMDMCKNARHYFADGEYMLADSAYPITPTCVPLFKGAEAKHTDNVHFNFCGAHVRVANEHAIGLLKGRWSSLRELRVVARKDSAERDIGRMVRWTVACAVLHNLLIDWRDTWRNDAEVEAIASAQAQPPRVTHQENAEIHGASSDDGRLFREEVRDRCLALQRSKRDGFLQYALRTRPELNHAQDAESQ